MERLLQNEGTYNSEDAELRKGKNKINILYITQINKFCEIMTVKYPDISLIIPCNTLADPDYYLK